MIYIISNVEYPKENKLNPKNEDLLVFLNKSKSIEYYPEHKNKIIIRRMPKSEYGNRI